MQQSDLNDRAMYRVPMIFRDGRESEFLITEFTDKDESLAAITASLQEVYKNRPDHYDMVDVWQRLEELFPNLDIRATIQYDGEVGSEYFINGTGTAYPSDFARQVMQAIKKSKFPVIYAFIDSDRVTLIPDHDYLTFEKFVDAICDFARIDWTGEYYHNTARGRYVITPRC
jgi:hypothetical protein